MKKQFQKLWNQWDVVDLENPLEKILVYKEVSKEVTPKKWISPAVKKVTSQKQKNNPLDTGDLIENHKNVILDFLGRAAEYMHIIYYLCEIQIKIQSLLESLAWVTQMKGIKRESLDDKLYPLQVFL